MENETDTFSVAFDRVVNLYSGQRLKQNDATVRHSNEMKCVIKRCTIPSSYKKKPTMETSKHRAKNAQHQPWLELHENKYEKNHVYRQFFFCDLKRFVTFFFICR